jgi:hypothetical protein
MGGGYTHGEQRHLNATKCESGISNQLRHAPLPRLDDSAARF